MQTEAIHIVTEATTSGRLELMFNKAPATTGAIDPDIFENDDAIPTAVPRQDGIKTSGVYA